jgi:hypothetical protein
VLPDHSLRIMAKPDSSFEATVWIILVPRVLRLELHINVQCTFDAAHPWKLKM